MRRFTRFSAGGATLLIAGALALAACSSATPTSLKSTTTTTVAPTTTGPKTTSTSSSTTTSSVAPTTTAPTTTVVAGPPPCNAAELKIAKGKSSGAAGTIATGFIITTTSSTPCELNGYPKIGLVPHSGTVHPVVTDNGGPPSTVVVSSGAIGAAFAFQYSDVQQNGQTSCPRIDAVRITLPGTGSVKTVADRFYPCGAPNVETTAVESPAKYHSQFG
jgi:hypothetical protein